MTPERWRQIKELLDAAVVLPPAAREAYLASACGRDEDLRREVDSLLLSHEAAASGFLESPLSRGAGSHLPSAAATVGSGTRIGPYLLQEALGRGGMGEVFAAVRADGQYEQRVALKLVRGGVSTPELLERFRAERQILAGLDHPNIARLVDGGTTGDGVPYFVMELVDGVPIDTFCRDRALAIRERLTLFLHVCAAVEYAHQRLVIHRDLKPGNILVTREGVPKLLDFGIAKMLNPLGNVPDTSLRPLTLEYASPEQVRGETVSTASDVYALAVVLYQLLTGRLPYAEGDTSTALADAITRRDPLAVPRDLRGDVEVILLKALRKEPDKRYASVEQFAGDIRRHLEGLPVAARMGTWSYYSGKFVRRHRAGVAAAGVILATLVAGIVVTAREARIAEANRRRADARFNDVRKLAKSLIFEIHDSIQNVPGAIDARKLILQRSVEYLDSLAKEGGNEPDLMRELATAYGRIGTLQSAGSRVSQIADTKSAQTNLEKAVTMRESLARENPGNGRDRVDLAGAYASYGEFETGALGNTRLGFDYERKALTLLDREAQVTPEDAQVINLTLQCLVALGLMQVGNGMQTAVGTPAQGIADLERAQQLLARELARSPADEHLRERQGSIEGMIAQALMFMGDRRAAVAHYQRGIELLEPLVQRNNYTAAFNVTVFMARTGDALLIDGQTAQALPHYVEAERRAAAMAARDLHNDTVQQNHASTLITMGHAMAELGRMEDGMQAIRTALAILAAAPDTADTRAREALARGWLGEALERQGDVHAASQQYSVTKARLGELLAKGIDNPRTQGFYAVACDRLGTALVALGDVDAGIREYAQAQRRLEPLVKANPPAQELAYALADTYTRQGTAESLLAERAKSPLDKQAHWRVARASFQRSLEVWKGIDHPASISGVGFEVTPPADVARKRAQCERALQAPAIN